MIPLRAFHLATWIVLGLTFTFWTGARADNGEQQVERDRKTLVSCTMFALGPVGIAGTTSEGELAMRNLLQVDGAVSLFGEIVNEATPEGRLYALIALRSLDRSAYRNALAEMPRDLEITTQRGCIVTKQTVDEVLDAVDAGAYDSLLPQIEPN